MRRAALLALVLACTLAAAACASRAPQRTLRLMTFNIAAGNGNLAGMAEVIRAAAPDIVALQEVDVRWSDRSDFVDQAARLGDMLGMNVRFAPIYRLPGEGTAPTREFGLAVLSRAPVVEFRNHEITRLSTQSGDTVPRALPGFPEAVIDFGGVRVRVFNTHLDYRADPRIRSSQVAEMLAIIGKMDEPTILMGDLNAPPDAGEIAPLLARLRDTWRHPGPGFTYPAAEPKRRIDYVLVSDHFTVLAGRVIPSTASDHRPVIADLLLDQAR